MPFRAAQARDRDGGHDQQPGGGEGSDENALDGGNATPSQEQQRWGRGTQVGLRQRAGAHLLNQVGHHLRPRKPNT